MIMFILGVVVGTFVTIMAISLLMINRESAFREELDEQIKHSHRKDD